MELFKRYPQLQGAAKAVLIGADNSTLTKRT